LHRNGGLAVISSEAARCFQLIKGIRVCKDVDAAFWEQMLTRVIIDIDDDGGRCGRATLAHVGDVLAKLWEELPDRETPNIG